MLQLVLQEQVQYPWNPAESEAFFAGIEAATADEWETGELAARGNAIASQLDSLWAAIDQTAIDQTAAHPQVATLFSRVAGRVPQQIIAGIVARSQQLITANLSLTEQMVQCVQEFVADCNPEDLLLTSRKFAVVRSRSTTNGFVDTALQQVREADWSELSAGEQAFLSLAIAHAALTDDAKTGDAKTNDAKAGE
ncbi:MAG: hypothetical protein HC895_18365 [Leptolyngbyaceae cyanobacterium SM1_3_5]|nr:hypothetical protein [Leptolyngbyaceae cyanobacterium SM1_3_5]